MAITRNVFQFILIVSIASLLVSCGVLQDKRSLSPHAAKLSDSVYVKKVLYSQFNDWRGVRYQYGGVSRLGIDCSGFVYVTFKTKLGIDLPRTTAMQVKLGEEISQSELRPGDLIFFRTTFLSGHVGIFLEKNKFLHVSEKKGVTLSSLNDSYWKSNYWKSVRI